MTKTLIALVALAGLASTARPAGAQAAPQPIAVRFAATDAGVFLTITPDAVRRVAGHVNPAGRSLVTPAPRTSLAPRADNLPRIDSAARLANTLRVPGTRLSGESLLTSPEIAVGGAAQTALVQIDSDSEQKKAAVHLSGTNHLARVRMHFAGLRGGLSTSFSGLLASFLTLAASTGISLLGTLSAYRAQAEAWATSAIARGVEIASDVADDVNRSVIAEQVEMGVAVRMACLDVLTRNRRGVA